MTGKQGTDFVFIVRASARDGLGHLVRSLSVMRESRAHGSCQLLLLGENTVGHLIGEAGLPWRYCETDDEAARTAAALTPGLVAFDTLDFDAAAFDLVSQQAITVSLSPIFTRMQSVGHLFHRTAVGDPAWPQEGPFPQVHASLKFTVLPPWLKRVSVREYRHHLAEDKLAVAISMGGSDAPNRTLELLRLFGQLSSKLVLFVAIGDAYTHSYEDLIASASSNRQEIILLKSNESMWRVLRQTSLLVCAGGLTTTEAAYIGIPSINVPQRAEWMYLFEEIGSAGACRSIPPSPEALCEAVAAVAALERDRNLLFHMHAATKNLIPPGGAKRIAKRLASLARTHRL